MQKNRLARKNENKENLQDTGEEMGTAKKKTHYKEPSKVTHNSNKMFYTGQNYNQLHKETKKDGYGNHGNYAVHRKLCSVEPLWRNNLRGSGYNYLFFVF